MIKEQFVLGEQAVFTPQKVSVLVQKLGKFESRILLESGNKKANGKSLIGMLSMELGPGAEVTLTVDGPDEQEALAAVLGLVDRA